MDVSPEDAIRVLEKWKASAPRLRFVFGSDYVLVNCRCTIHTAKDASWIWCIGEHFGDEVRFDLSSAASISVVCGVAGGRDALNELALSISWPDGTRLNVVKDKTTFRENWAS